MSKFKKDDDKGQPAISTAALPDIVFMLLFFFMVTTVMREVDLMVDVATPTASEVEKLVDKQAVAYVYIGKPTSSNQKEYGAESVIQLGGDIKPADHIPQYVTEVRTKLPEEKQKKMVVSLKVDSDTKMRIVTKTKQKLRTAQAYKISYSTVEGDPLKVGK